MPTANLTSQGPFAESACVWGIISAMNDVVCILRCKECNEALTLRGVAAFLGRESNKKTLVTSMLLYIVFLKFAVPDLALQVFVPSHRLDVLLRFLEVLISPETLQMYNGLPVLGVRCWLRNEKLKTTMKCFDALQFP